MAKTRLSGGCSGSTEDLVWDRAKGELRLFGRRHTAIDAQSLCSHLDTLVGVQVAEVIMNNLESRLGKEDGTRVRKENTKAGVNELVEMLIESDLLSGVGVTGVTLPEDQASLITVEISNPSVKGTTGASKAFLFSWWAGALTSVLGRELEVKNAVYDEEKNVMKCEIGPRPTK